MARKAEAIQEEEVQVQPLQSSREVALSQQDVGGPPAELLEDMKKDAGRGFSQHRDDSVLPLIRVLQDLSPQVKPRDPAYIEGAQAGDFFIPANGRVIKGSEGLDVIPVAFHHEYVEWRPRGQGGIVAKHPLGQLPEDVDEFMEKNRPRLKRGDNEVIDTRYHFFIYGSQGYVMSFTGTGHQTSRRWTFMMSSHRQNSGESYPSFARRYQMKTSLRKNPEGEWYGIDIYELGWTTPVQYRLARAMADAIDSGAKVAEEDSGSVDSGSVGSDRRVDDKIPF